VPTRLDGEPRHILYSRLIRHGGDFVVSGSPAHPSQYASAERAAVRAGAPTLVTYSRAKRGVVEDLLIEALTAERPDTCEPGNRDCTARAPRNERADSTREAATLIPDRHVQQLTVFQAQTTRRLPHMDLIFGCDERGEFHRVKVTLHEQEIRHVLVYLAASGLVDTVFAIASDGGRRRMNLRRQTREPGR
jgi:hypothetical protein